MILAEENMALTLTERDRLCKEIRDELLGYCPLEPLLKDHGINDILVNGRCMWSAKASSNSAGCVSRTMAIFSRSLKK
jgi:Flp pilus assembly CpaF family ATPase